MSRANAKIQDLTPSVACSWFGRRSRSLPDAAGRWDGARPAAARRPHPGGGSTPSILAGARPSEPVSGTRPCCSEARAPRSWSHLASDPERVLELAVDYMALGLWDDAHALLARRYPASGVVAEPGTVLPQEYPLVAYYRGGYCAEKDMGRSGRDDFALASRQSTRYVFPNRPESLVVLRRVVEIAPEDATAHFLLGSLYLSGGRTDDALAESAKARAPRSAAPRAPRNIGFTLFYTSGCPKTPARLRGGDECGSDEVELYQGADQALTSPAGSRGPDRRLAAPAAPLPSTLVYKLALALARPAASPRRRRSSPGASSPRGVADDVRQVYLEVKLDRRWHSPARVAMRKRRHWRRARTARARVRLHEGRHRGLRRCAALPVLPGRAAGTPG